jgi:hypothetical protein
MKLTAVLGDGQPTQTNSNVRTSLVLIGFVMMSEQIECDNGG